MREVGIRSDGGMDGRMQGEGLRASRGDDWARW